MSTRLVIPLLALGSVLAAVRPSPAFETDRRWTTTATNPSAGVLGDPLTVTWSIVPDGTLIRNEIMVVDEEVVFELSALIARLDTIYNESATGPDVTNRSWFSLFTQAFDRWSELGGVTFLHESSDDMAEHGEVVEGNGMFFAGELGVRGDVRIGGAPIDGNAKTVAYNYYPDVSDMVIDTDDNYFTAIQNNSRRLRNTLMHEAGHSIGLAHVALSSGEFLMEPNIGTTFEGPQFDDILGVHHLYGDALEKTNNGAGNNTAANATDLGLVAAGLPRTLGADAMGDIGVTLDDTDFVSIAHSSDDDYFRFSITRASRVTVRLTPAGPTYEVGPQFGPQVEINAAALSDLALELYTPDGLTLLAGSDTGLVGDAESIAGFALPSPGEYLVRVFGKGAETQFYQLELAIAPLLSGDYNFDGAVDAADYTVWRDTLGQTGLDLAADGDGNQAVDGTDYAVWKEHFGQTVSMAALRSLEIPEPTTGWLLAWAAVSFGWLSKELRLT